MWNVRRWGDSYFVSCVHHPPPLASFPNDRIADRRGIPAVKIESLVGRFGLGGYRSILNSSTPNKELRSALWKPILYIELLLIPRVLTVES